MKTIRIFSISCIILLLCCAAGCLSGNGTQPAPATTTPTQVPETSVPTTEVTAISLAPGPTQTLPDDYDVDVQVEKENEAGLPVITVTFRGGKGMTFTQQVNIRVTRSDGIVETATMNKPSVGDERKLQGTIYDDRVEVSIFVATGNSYTVYDQLVPYQSINP